MKSSATISGIAAGPVPSGSLRRALDVVLRKPVYLAQFRRLGEAPERRRPGKVAGPLLDVLLAEGVVKRKAGAGGKARYGLSLRGQELLGLLDDLDWLDRLAETLDTHPVQVLRTRTKAGAAAVTVRRVLRERGMAAWLERLPETGGFMASDLLDGMPAAAAAAARQEAGLMLRFLKTRGLLVRSRFVRDRPSEYRMTDFGRGIRNFMIRLRELDGGRADGFGEAGAGATVPSGDFTESRKTA
ncbi:hypothetical protein OpiT1DRAFT_03252 [Opitutaceae bacterium TAV1]|nr:hypothetical protein OpiT1DRAFT_03252 [Opitutaceae bacterium TAV1]